MRKLAYGLAAAAVAGLLFFGADRREEQREQRTEQLIETKYQKMTREISERLRENGNVYGSVEYPYDRIPILNRIGRFEPHEWDSVVNIKNRHFIVSYRLSDRYNDVSIICTDLPNPGFNDLDCDGSPDTFQAYDLLDRGYNSMRKIEYFQEPFRFILKGFHRRLLREAHSQLVRRKLPE